MKKTLVVAIALIALSCKEKLPSNIKSELSSYKFAANFNKPSDSLIVSLTKEEIDDLSDEKISSLIFRDAYASDDYDNAEKKLDELLKYNSKYSDYDEVKNKTEFYRNLNLEINKKYWDNITYLRAVEHYRFMSKYDKNYEKPKYGF